MDRVRFGRALGVGARAAAKSLISAAEAAAAPAPGEATRRPAGRPASQPAAARIRVPDAQVVRQHARGLKRSVWSPFAKFTGVLWLEVTGTFFAIFALIAGQQVWKWRGAVRLSPRAPEAQHFYVYVGLLVLFGYFAVSSFVRARRRQRR